ncbi:hypothetical protein PSTG_18424 [Puccinia striiformis f. sp. tritici PST-78]|uniref:Uncharacterized protein n=1 Tax=Puccinia striiformis f. sp. tritici PST-78 TaxID=1165861 RepID=A0A0L0UMG8_9BASI|nr:hypothetical protein PSTG_18424 [Puccinia striiformis f. sp. tritici PST-78]
MDLFIQEEPSCCVQPQNYEIRGRPFDLTEEDLHFIKNLVTKKPSIYAEEI